MGIVYKRDLIVINVVVEEVRQRIEIDQRLGLRSDGHDGASGVVRVVRGVIDGEGKDAGALCKRGYETRRGDGDAVAGTLIAEEDVWAVAQQPGNFEWATYGDAAGELVGRGLGCVEAGKRVRACVQGRVVYAREERDVVHRFSAGRVAETRRERELRGSRVVDAAIDEQAIGGLRRGFF